MLVNNFPFKKVNKSKQITPTYSMCYTIKYIKKGTGLQLISVSAIFLHLDKKLWVNSGLTDEALSKDNSHFVILLQFIFKSVGLQVYWPNFLQMS